MRNGETNHRSLRLDEAREATPPVSAIKAMQSNLQLALFGAIGEADVLAIAAKLKEQALAGDLKAMKLLFSLIVPPAPQGRPINVTQGVQVNEPQPAVPAPTSVPAGTEAKLLLMQERLAAGQALTSPEDAPPPAKGPAHGRFEMNDSVRTGRVLGGQ